jgi:CheY-like chemotaxis protein
MIELATILYVEDDPDIQNIGKLALEHIGGFKVSCCNSGREALAKLKSSTPQLLLLDVMMPDMDGIETYKSVRALSNGKDIPVVFMTAKVQASEIKEYVSMGAIGVISKPFEVANLPDQLRSIWESHHNPA